MTKINTSNFRKVPTAGEKAESLRKPGKRKKRKRMSKLQKNKNNSKSGYWARQADTLWYKYQHSIIHYCAIPGADFTGIEVSEKAMECEGNVEIHHLIEKSQHAKARHLLENAIGLCSKHHNFDVELSAHQGQVKFYEFLRINFPDKHEFFLKYKFTNTKDYDYREAYEHLKELME